MSIAKMRSMFDEANKRRQRGWSGSQYSDSSRNTFDPAQSFSTQHSGDFDYESDTYKPPTDTEMLDRARAAHNNTDFAALAAGPGSGGPWQRVEAADAF
ncbi:hypothetical protein PR003_g20592 [Phytophthora rubi]|uniref:Uncharacterized protein n=1 Tax=Phytophthora rubi TaxID=129364 RepID=A0A6A4DPE5_9STRA|nr:hypothetical protein PR002_g19757 [Phytophthora rubi]KAE8997438.1 hypothetical protein PR001_g19580 [Phytophthora rubi]KAE9309068.1 hypothetical protein PR003_g20592 [Phytophthora rubi]